MKNDKMKNQYRINEQIRVREVRIVSDGGSTVVPTRQAIEMAREQEADLVEISPNANPPVCRIIDYSKFLYQQKKRAKEMKANKVRAYVFFRGRSILFKEQGEVLLLRFANDLEDWGKVESMPSLEGKKMFLYLAPKKTGGSTKKSQQARDREAAAAEAKEAAKQQSAAMPADIDADAPANGGLLANAKISADALKKLTESADE